MFIPLVANITQNPILFYPPFLLWSIRQIIGRARFCVGAKNSRALLFSRRDLQKNGICASTPDAGTI
jgi:hypothetical protein